MTTLEMIEELSEEEGPLSGHTGLYVLYESLIMCETCEAQWRAEETASGRLIPRLLLQGDGSCGQHEEFTEDLDPLDDDCLP